MAKTRVPLSESKPFVPEFSGDTRENFKKVLEGLKEIKDYPQIINLMRSLLPKNLDLEEMDLNELENQSGKKINILWRGTDPVDIMKVMSGLEELPLESDFANIADNWQKSISYGAPGIRNEEGKSLRFNAAIGFDPRHLTVEGRAIAPQDQKDYYPEVVRVEKGNYRGTGQINLPEIKYLMLRGHRDVRAGQKEMPAPVLYRLIEKEEAA